MKFSLKSGDIKLERLMGRCGTKDFSRLQKNLLLKIIETSWQRTKEKLTNGFFSFERELKDFFRELEVLIN